MPELPVISGEDCIKTLEKAGYVVTRSRGSHVRLVCAGRPPVTAPRHRELDRGTLRAIIRQADLTVEDFLRLRD